MFYSGVKGLVPHSHSWLAFLMYLLGTFSYEKNTILCSNEIVFTFECQAWITMADIRQKYKVKFFFKWVLNLNFCKKFLLIFRLKNSTIKGMFEYNFNLYLPLYSSKVKTIILQHKTVCIRQQKISTDYIRNVSELCEWGDIS
jgi:hypothetical protein